jgi:predicted alpha/beta hydrolase family esterase
MFRTIRKHDFILVALATCALIAVFGCHRPETWPYIGPRVYLIEGAPSEQSDGLTQIRDELEKREINAKIYTPDNWLKIVVDIDSRPDEEVILVGHGHGAFLATQVVRHYAQEHKTKFIEAVFTLDAFNKDWPHNWNESGEMDPHHKPMNTPIGHNALKVRNYSQSNPDSRRWGSDLVSTRASNVATEHPYYWYDDYWNRRPVTGQVLVQGVDGVTHETLSSDADLIEMITLMCRRAALSPFHYTPAYHHPDVAKSPAKAVQPRPGKA